MAAQLAASQEGLSSVSKLKESYEPLFSLYSLHISVNYTTIREHTVVWLRHYATSFNVAGSMPDEFSDSIFIRTQNV
jgi:membrane-bound metal-dependent hydrolase YbcI (DUF457 family)